MPPHVRRGRRPRANLWPGSTASRCRRPALVRVKTARLSPRLWKGYCATTRTRGSLLGPSTAGAVGEEASGRVAGTGVCGATQRRRSLFPGSETLYLYSPLAVPERRERRGHLFVSPRPRKSARVFATAPFHSPETGEGFTHTNQGNTVVALPGVVEGARSSSGCGAAYPCRRHGGSSQDGP